MSANDPSIPADAPAVTDDERLQLVSFMVGEEEFAIPILSVQEINRMMPVTRVPQSPPFVEGVVNLRGKMIPVMDLRKRFGMPSLGDAADTRIIVVEVRVRGGTRVIGFTVDRVRQVLRISESIVEAAPQAGAGSAAGDGEHVLGVGKLEGRRLILLDLEKLFGDDHLAACDQALAAA